VQRPLGGGEREVVHEPPVARQDRDSEHAVLLHREEDAVREALALWEERERQRVAFRASLEDARASLARGEGREITEETIRRLAEEVKERGRARLAAELAALR